MRIWHKDLISVLPRKQLIGQWRECCLMAKTIAETGTINHILINKVVTDYSIEHLFRYADLIYREMIFRGYKCNREKMFKYCRKLGFNMELYLDISRKSIFFIWHNNRYLKQCYYNLQEKYDCGGISEEEWKRVNEGIKRIGVDIDVDD